MVVPVVLTDEDASSRRHSIHKFCNAFHWTSADRRAFVNSLYGLDKCHDEFFTLLAKSDGIRIPDSAYAGTLASELSFMACTDICDVLFWLVARGSIQSVLSPSVNDIFLRKSSPDSLHQYFARYNGRRRPNKNTVIADFIKRSDALHEFDMDLWLLQNKRRLLIHDTVADFRRELRTNRNLISSASGRVSYSFLAHFDEVFSIIDNSNGRIDESNLKPIDVFNYRARAQGNPEAFHYDPANDQILYVQDAYDSDNN